MFESETSHFSFFDFLGYLLPGALCLMVVKWAAILWDIQFWGIKDWIALLQINAIEGDSWLIESLWLLVLSYLMGHVVSFLSSVTIEVFSHKMYKYPSDFLLLRLWKNDEAGNKKEGRKSKDKAKGKKGLDAPFILNGFLYTLIRIIILPISLPAYLLGRWLGFEYYYLKPLDDIYVWNINHRFRALMKKLNFYLGPGEDSKTIQFGEERACKAYNSDFHRIAYNYEYEKTKQHQSKMDSYIALYGFMRAASFLSVVLFWIFIIVLTKQSLWCTEAWLFMAIYSPLPYILFMAFMKFYRRHTLETFMCLLVDEELASADIAKSIGEKIEPSSSEGKTSLQTDSKNKDNEG